MGGANQVTSYHVTLTNDELQSVKLRVMNPVLFEKIHEGDTGTAVVRGNILLSFKKRDYSYFPATCESVTTPCGFLCRRPFNFLG